MNAGVFHVESKHSKIQGIAVAGTLYPLSLVERADTNEAGPAAVRKQNVSMMNERNGLVYQLETL